MTKAEGPSHCSLPPGLARFNYWHHLAINPLFPGDERQAAIAAHRALSSHYRKQFLSGDHEAIYKYVKADPLALESAWVREAVASWRTQGGSINRMRCEKFFRAYWSERGRRRAETLIAAIERDQQVFKDILERKPLGEKSGEACMRNVARGRGMALESVREIYKEYRAEMKARLGTFERRPEVSELLEKVRQEISRRRGKEVVLRGPKAHMKEKQFFTFLRLCLKNLKRYSEGKPPRRRLSPIPPITVNLEL